ncbi:hypothetical protein [Halobacillus litoralis]|uniref:hypothetical protein n=1 Tax=Halobacillus litoralis TaxID=45668 RepID=UPI001CFCBF55|nr:hypothetical protein [Halobacillus litoralis]
MIKRTLFLTATFLVLTACSSQNLDFEDLKTAYPDTFAKPLEDMKETKKNKIGLPDELPFEPSTVKTSAGENKVEVLYSANSSEKAEVTTIYQPGNILQQSELQVPLNTGAVAGVQEKDNYVFVEWYDGDQDVIYQVKYYGPKEERSERALTIANAI